MPLINSPMWILINKFWHQRIPPRFITPPFCRLSIPQCELLSINFDSKGYRQDLLYPILPLINSPMWILINKFWEQRIPPRFITPKFAAINNPLRFLITKLWHQRAPPKFITPQFAAINNPLRYLINKFWHQRIPPRFITPQFCRLSIAQCEFLSINFDSKGYRQDLLPLNFAAYQYPNVNSYQ